MDKERWKNHSHRTWKHQQWTIKIIRIEPENNNGPCVENYNIIQYHSRSFLFSKVDLKGVAYPQSGIFFCRRLAFDKEKSVWLTGFVFFSFRDDSHIFCKKPVRSSMRMGWRVSVYKRAFNSSKTVSWTLSF